MSRILVVDDEEHIAEGLRFNLEAEGYRVDVAPDGALAAERLVSASGEDGFDLVILDVMLPEVGGFEVARRARAAGNLVPILMLTAKQSISDRVRGIEDGADDYLTKPFRLDELLARVRALLRRRRWDGASPSDEAERSFRFGSDGELCLHYDRFELETPSGVQRLTTRELALLRALIERAGRAVTRGELLEEVWGLRPDTQTRVVDSFIVRLRRYVEKDPAKPRHIVSVRGHGYRFDH